MGNKKGMQTNRNSRALKDGWLGGSSLWSQESQKRSKVKSLNQKDGKTTKQKKAFKQI